MILIRDTKFYKSRSLPIGPRLTQVLAAYVAARLAALQLVGTKDEWRLEAIAAAMASLNVEAPTLEHVPSLRELCAALLTPRS
jgi:hypothetical protein